MASMKVISIAVIMWFGAVSSAAVRTGLDNVSAHTDLFKGRRVGIIANHTSYNSEGRYIVDVFRAMEGVRVVALFSPEHGLRGSEEAGAKIGNGTDPVTGLPVHSLYSGTNKPTPQMLADVDVLVFDIQDVGARFYTYLYTMSLAMEAAAENHKRFVVLDRPNPINGVQLEGPALEPKFATFVGLYPIPVRYGLAVGELAKMINGEGWLAKGVKADLTVVPLTGWHRGMWFDQTGLRFIKPSPNMPDLETATLYPGLCLLEGTNLSEGRGTPKPFRQFGAPWIDSTALAAKLNALNLPGVRFQPASFTPTSSKFQNQKCHGVEILLTDRTRLEPFWSGVLIVNELYQMYPSNFQWIEKHFDRLCGTATIREAIIARRPLPLLKANWATECRTFQSARQPYLLYHDGTAENKAPRALVRTANAVSFVLPLSWLWLAPLIIVAILWWWIKSICQRRGYVPASLHGGLLRRFAQLIENESDPRLRSRYRLLLGATYVCLLVLVVGFIGSIVLAKWPGATPPPAVRIGLGSFSVGGPGGLKGQRIGIIADDPSYSDEGKHIVDVLRAMKDIRVVALFCPEYSSRGSEEGGRGADNETDPVTGLPIYHLPGQTGKPTPEMLANVDVLVFGLQDAGARFSTCLSMMSLAMQAAAENGKQLIVPDRPNPINGVQVEGPILDPNFASFVGRYPIPVRHGMTMGEMARMIDGERWLGKGIHADFVVPLMGGWNRQMWFDQTGLPFVKPSPDIPDIETEALYPGLCLLEGTNVSEGRGTPKPFRQFGAPWIASGSLTAQLNALNLPGVQFRPTSFTPTSSKFQNQNCHGVEILLTDRTRLEPFWTGVQIVNELRRSYSDRFQWKEEHFDRLCGTATVREAITAQKPLQPLRETWMAECRAFDQMRLKYFFYAE
jgi:uncharacterized protein YbbC (DUF1343 family)